MNALTCMLRFSSLTRFEVAVVLIGGWCEVMTLSAGKDLIRFFKSLNFSVGASATESLAALRAVPWKLSPAATAWAVAAMTRGAPASVGGGPSYESISLVLRMRKVPRRAGSAALSAKLIESRAGKPARSGFTERLAIAAARPAGLACFFEDELGIGSVLDRKSTRLNSSHSQISYAV